jgi:hypothetical protein
MKGKMKRLVEFGLVMLVLGLNMLLFPIMFEKPGKLHFDASEALYIGIIMTAIGGVILGWRIIVWLKSPDEGKAK